MPTGLGSDVAIEKHHLSHSWTWCFILQAKFWGQSNVAGCSITTILVSEKCGMLTGAMLTLSRDRIMTAASPSLHQ